MAGLLIMCMEEVRRSLWCEGGRSIDQASRVLDNCLSCVRCRNCRTSSRRCGYERDLTQLGPVVRLGHVWGGVRRASRIGSRHRLSSSKSRGPLLGGPRDNRGGRDRVWESAYPSLREDQVLARLRLGRRQDHEPVIPARRQNGADSIPVQLA